MTRTRRGYIARRRRTKMPKDECIWPGPAQI